MKRQFRFGTWRGLCLAGACLLAAALVKPVQDRIDGQRNQPSIDPDLLYFTSPAAIKAMALGYDSMVADIYWMRAIQYYGRRDEAERRPVRYKNLPALLDIVTTLDPKMLEVYRAGSIFLAEAEPIGAGLPQESLRLLEKGIQYHPREWRLWFDKGLVCFWFLKDFQQAGKVWLEAANISTSPPWMKALAASALSRAGAVETAKELWRQQLAGSARQDLRDNARKYLVSIQVDEDLWTLEFFLEKYLAARGTRAAGLQDLVTAGYFRYVPSDPSGTPYRYDPATGDVMVAADSKVRYLALSYDYKTSFREQLERRYGPLRK